MSTVTAGSVRDRISISVSEAPDNVVTQFIADAAETVALETGLTINPENCTTQEAVAIRNLAAIYRAARVTGVKLRG